MKLAQNKTVYINRLEKNRRETVDQVALKDFNYDKPAFRFEINNLLDNYSKADSTALYYESNRCCANWR